VGEPARESVAVVVVTHNRADLLGRMLDGLVAQTWQPDAVIVVDNASGDHTQQVLDRHDLPLQVIRSEENVGGAGGFRIGMETAYVAGWDRIWLMDDDVVPAPDCLATLMAVDEPCLMCVREDLDGRLVEKSATTFDLRNPLAIKPKTASVETTYGTRDAMPPLVEIQVVAFEGFLVRHEVVAAVGLPDPEFFIFYEDADYALRASKAGYRIWAVRDAVLVRQLAFSQELALESWKGYYMYRNLFVVHFRHGQNALVRAQPYAISAAVVALSPLRGGRAEAGNVMRAVRDARRMRAESGGVPTRR
jgi:GT2 family glycosyltransferase